MTQVNIAQFNGKKSESKQLICFTLLLILILLLLTVLPYYSLFPKITVLRAQLSQPRGQNSKYKLRVGYTYIYELTSLGFHACRTPTGLLMFAITHILYSSAFGMKPINLSAGLIITAVSSLSYVLLYPYLSGPFTYLVAVYIGLIGFMGWRAVAGLQLANDLWTWTKLSACLGAVLFMVSDLTIAVNKFCFPVPHSRAIIMATYYAAQMLIALSAVECQDAEVARKRA